MSYRPEKLASLGGSTVVICGIVGVLLYCVFTFMSCLCFPIPFSPFEHVLSELGVSSSNPHGAVFYSIGVFVLGCSLLPFFLGVYTWFTKRERKRRWVLAFAAGVFTAISLLMTGIFPGDFLFLHFIWAVLFFISVALTIILVNTSLFHQPRIDRRIILFGYLVVAFDLFFLLQVLYGGTVIVVFTEWITVFAFLGWVVLVAGIVLRESLMVQRN